MLEKNLKLVIPSSFFLYSNKIIIQPVLQAQNTGITLDSSLYISNLSTSIMGFFF